MYYRLLNLHNQDKFMSKLLDKATAFLYLWIIFYIYIILNDTYIPKGSFITIAINALIFLYSIYLITISIYKAKFFFLFLYLLFLLILIIFTSSDFNYSFKLWMKYSMGIICLPIGFEIFNSRNLKTIWIISKCFLFLFLINYLLANLLHWGRHMYENNIAWTEVGNLVDDGLQLNICVIALFPFYLSRIRHSVVIIVVASLCLILTFVMMKRTPIACFFLCFGLYVTSNFYFIKKYGKTAERLKISGVFVIFFIIVFSAMAYLFSDLFISNYNNRFSKMDIGDNQRTKELEIIFNDIMNTEDSKIFLLGKETFNTVGTYNNGKWGRRMIHDNYAIILNGTGILGFVYYIFLNLYLFFIFLRYSRRVDFYDNNDARQLFFIYLSYWCMYMLTSMSGTIWLTLYPAFHFTISGMILRYFYDYGNIMRI